MLTSYKLFVESVITRKKDQEIFNYKSIIQDAWRPIIQKAQKFQNISFDLENNDSTGEKKTIFVKKDLRKDQPVKYEFNAELFRAGGDWEFPVLYFKVEFTHDYGVVNSKHKVEYVFDDLKDKSYSGLSRCYVLIPGPEDGNHLVKTEKGYRAYTDDLSKEGVEKKDIVITDEDRKKAWKWLEDLLTKLVDERHEMLDRNDDDKLSAEPVSDPSPEPPVKTFETFNPKKKKREWPAGKLDPEIKNAFGGKGGLFDVHDEEMEKNIGRYITFNGGSSVSGRGLVHNYIHKIIAIQKNYKDELCYRVIPVEGPSAGSRGGNFGSVADPKEITILPADFKLPD
jgi:hypothetical protein